MIKSGWKVAATVASAALLLAASAHAVVVITGGEATGAPGATVSVGVSLTADPEIVAGTENVIGYETTDLTIAARANGRPDCAVNPDIEKGGTAFAFQPSGCTGTACTAVKALVLALDNVDPILTGVVMYTCMVGIATDAVDGEYPLTCTSPGASDPAGGALNAECTSGIVTVGGVVGPTATPTATPVIDTPTPGATSTVTATSTRTIKPTNTPGGGGGGNDDDGCAVVAPAQSSNAWMLLLPAVALLWVRRRTR